MNADQKQLAANARENMRIMLKLDSCSYAQFAAKQLSFLRRPA
jgi:hypothetical protein